jgi:hypothetical protein
MMDLWFAQEAGWTDEGKETFRPGLLTLLTAPLLSASTNMPHGASGHAVGSPNSQHLAAVPSTTNTVVPSGELQENQVGMITHAELPPPAHEQHLVQDPSLNNYPQSRHPGVVQMTGVSLNVAITSSDHQGLAEQVSETPLGAAYTRRRLTTINSPANSASPSPLEPWKMSPTASHLTGS